MFNEIGPRTLSPSASTLSKSPGLFIHILGLGGAHVCSQCTMLPLSTKSCLKSSKLKPINVNGQFCHAISKNICLNVLGFKQP